MTTRLIKSAHIETAGAAPLPLVLPDVEREAEAILAEARRQAAELLRHAADESRAKVSEALALARREGFEKGRQEGLAAGRTEALETTTREVRELLAAETAPVRSMLEAIIAQWKERHRALFLDARQDVVALAIAIARRVVPRLAELDSNAAADAAAAALEMIGKTHHLVIRAHPRDIDALKRHLAEAGDRLLTARTVRWAADESIERGGVRLDGDGGAVDARLSTQLDRIADELLDDWRKRL